MISGGKSADWKGGDVESDERKITSGTVWVESSRGNWIPYSFKVSGKGATEKALEEYIREKLPTCKMIVFSKETRQCPRK